MKEKRIVLTNEKIALLAEKVRPYLTEKRYAHTVSVAREAEALGKRYLPTEINRLKAAALLHDITKKADAKKQLQYLAEFGIIKKGDGVRSPSVFHARTGAALARRDFSAFTDEEILGAIRWHTTGHEGMSVFEALIYLADYIEETRDFEDCVRLRSYFYDRLACGDDPDTVLTDTMIYSFDLTVDNLVRDGAPIDTDTILARNYYLTEREKRNKQK